MAIDVLLAGKNKVANVTCREIGDEIGLERSQVHKGLKVLQENNLIEYETAPNGIVVSYPAEATISPTPEKGVVKTDTRAPRKAVSKTTTPTPVKVMDDGKIEVAPVLKLELMPTEKPPSDHQFIINYFCERYNLSSPDGTKYRFDGGRHGKNVSKLLDNYGLEKAIEMVDFVFDGDDEFLCKPDIGHLLRFSNQIARASAPKPEIDRALSKKGQKTLKTMMRLMNEDEKNG